MFFAWFVLVGGEKHAMDSTSEPMLINVTILPTTTQVGHGSLFPLKWALLLACGMFSLLSLYSYRNIYTHYVQG